MTLENLSPHIDLEHSRKYAEALVEAFGIGDAAVLDRLRWNHPRFRGLKDADIRAGEFSLADAQLVVARLHHFASWTQLLEHIERLTRPDTQVVRFEQAADAITVGDAVGLRARLREFPELARERSPRDHRATLLHYVAANGVEDYRQKSPGNAVAIAKELLDTGAVVDATCDAYGGGWTTLGLVATSQHPRGAGVQIPLIDLLLGYGAAPDGVRPDDSMVRWALANSCPEAAHALVERGARIDDLVAAAGVGRVDVVARLVETSSKDDRENALIMAARYGQYDVVRLLLDRGVDVAASDGMTALHHAAGLADLRMIRLLIERGGPLEKENAWGGTVLSSTLWFADNASAGEFEHRDYASTLDTLIAAGARTDVYPDMGRHIDAVYRRAGWAR